jgi:polyvinyl alcohol dehydrogenase (cytochrome)
VRRILLVTAREYRRITRLPAFWVVSLLIPAIVAALPRVQNLFGKSQTVGYVLVDKSGRFAAQINRRVELDYQQQVLISLSAYAREWHRGKAASPRERDVQTAAPLSDTAVENFVAAGGAPAVLRALQPTLLPSAPPFRAPPRAFVELPLPDGVATDNADLFAASLGAHFQKGSQTRSGQAPLGVAIYLPENVQSGGQARVWMSSQAGSALVQGLKLELTRALADRALARTGIDPLAAAQIETISAPLSIALLQEPGAGHEAAVHSALPLVLADMLLVSMVITGSMMLQGLVEERANKLLEAVLACVSARELLLGKLLGISAIGLSILGIWAGATLGIVHAEPTSPLRFLIPALASLAQTPWIAAAMIFYFLAGYLTIGMIFLAVGAVSDSMQEAQSYLVPLGLLIAAPSIGTANLIYHDPNGLVPQVFSWIPIYTPTTMLARLQGGVSTFDVLATVVELVAFGALELWLLGRLFQNRLIQTGQGFRLTPTMRRLTVRLVTSSIVAAVIALVIVVRHNRAPAPAPKAVLISSRGETVFRQTCASCHEPAIGRAPSREQLATFTPERIVESLTSGAMQPMAATLTGPDVRSVATYLAGRQPLGSSTMAADPPTCPMGGAAFSTHDGDWNGWSIDPRNERLQPNPGLTPADIPRLRVKWAFNYSGGKYGQPTIVGGRLFLTSINGEVYSLDEKTGCMFWRFTQAAPSRTTVSVGSAPGVAPSGYAAYFGDLSANVYAVDAASGALLWKTSVDSHPRSVLTGAPTLFKDRLYVPVSSWEETVAAVSTYSCCTFRGSLVALDRASGKTIWKTYAIERSPATTRKNSAGIQMHGPAGAAVWSAPTVDAKHNRVYFDTGNSYTDVAEGGSDAVIAVDLASGAIIWRQQLTRGDNSLSGCSPGSQLPNCPRVAGQDSDFGAAPILLTLASGKDILVAGQKSGTVRGIDPDSGEVIWRTQVGVGGFMGGVEWGMASDGQRLYVANADVLTSQDGRPGLFALDPATGKDLWYAPSPRVGCHWAGMPCFNAQSAAPSVIPDAIFAGTTDGHERAYASADGKVLWDFDTAGHPYRTINGAGDRTGGPIDVSSGTIGDGMLFVISGYLGNLGGRSDNLLLAFSVDGS